MHSNKKPVLNDVAARCSIDKFNQSTKLRKKSGLFTCILLALQPFGG